MESAKRARLEGRKTGAFDQEYGKRGETETMFEEALEQMGKGHHKKAFKLLQSVLRISPEFVPAYFGLAILSLHKEDRAGFEEQMRLAYEHAAQEDEKVEVLITKSQMLLDYGEPEKALEVLKECQAEHPGHSLRLNTPLVEAYLELDRKEDAWNLVQSAIPSQEAQHPDHFPIFINWILLMIELEKWDLWGKIQTRVKQFLKSIQEEEDRSSILETLLEEHDEYFELACYRGAEVFADLAHFLDPMNPDLFEIRKKAREMAQLEREFERMRDDEQLFPLVQLQAVEWFYEYVLDPDTFSEMMNEIPPDVLSQLEMMNEEYAAGILRLKKEYPLLYKHDRDRWDKLFAEKTAGLNREARRRLK
ncbi:heme biosynthesis protein HemY [Effusibacillus pohliae]|uniref:heme biosynthesis protein HemY n=1 Tax=Effusibacillus pohliae TaxID=232270 RepID=UPI000363D1D3|nr:hypothetical protein [Effusibacillus pohliae]